VKMEEIIYEAFCKEIECVHYNFIERLSCIETISPEIERSLEIARVYCQQNCEHTAHEFYQWILEKNISQWVRQKG